MKVFVCRVSNFVLHKLTQLLIFFYFFKCLQIFFIDGPNKFFSDFISTSFKATAHSNQSNRYWRLTHNRRPKHHLPQRVLLPFLFRKFLWKSVLSCQCCQKSIGHWTLRKKGLGLFPSHRSGISNGSSLFHIFIYFIQCIVFWQKVLLCSDRIGQNNKYCS